MKHVKFLFALLVLASMLLAACGGAAPATQAPATEAVATEIAATEAPATEAPAASGDIVKGGKVIVGSPQEPGTLNPVLASASIEDAISSFIIEGLVQVDADGKYAPILAEALPTVSEDGLTITYNLKKGVKWANGDAFTCSDVEFTYQVIMSDLSQASTSGYSDIDKFECVDETTVKLTMAEVYAPYLRLFSFILPKSAGDITKLDSWEYNRMPFGTGPWMLQEWKAGDSMTLAKNPNFREEGKPYLDSIIIRILPSRETGMQLLGTGEIQVLWDLVESDFPALAEMKDKGVSYGSAITGENELLLFNFGDPKEDAPADVTKTPHFALSDLKVREALELAIDKQLIVDTLLSGNVRVGTSVLPTGEFACPQDLSKYDPEAAKKLLDEAGWVPGADGIREKNGARLTLKITATSGNQVREQTEQVLADMFKQVGIELKIENVPSDTLFAGWDANGLRKHGQFDILLYTTGPGIDPDSHLFANYHSASIPVKENEGAGNNYSRYSNADVDKALDDAAGITDITKRRELYCSVVAQINKDKPRIYLYERLLISGYRINLQNFKVSPGPSDFSVASENWWLKP